MERLNRKRALHYAALVGLALLVLAGMWAWHQADRKSLEREFIQSHVATVVQPKQAAVEALFGSLYQNLRTISLLPSIRKISGANRAADTQDIVASGRFSPEGHETVQQIYNNLRSNVSVSEIYAVLHGLDAGKGEVPFFMYDALVFGEPKPEDEAAPNPDFPDEDEAAEYAYFPKQMDLIQKSNPTFNFTDPQQIPAFASPLMRTCDNTHYLSKAKGDERETFGMLYSVPFYDSGSKQFKGIISGILRGNVLEALLMGTPFVPVTPEDLAAQKKEGWGMPEPARFMLTNAAYGIQLTDRRSADLPALIQSGAEGRNTFKSTLNVQSDSPWILTYYLPESAIRAATADSDRAFYILVAVVVLVLGVAMVLLLMLGGIQGAVAEIGQVFSALAHGDFTRRVQMQLTGALGQLQSDSNHTIDKLNSIVVGIKEASNTISDAARDIADGNANIRQGTEDQVASLVQATQTMHSLTAMVGQSEDNARQANQNAQSASQVAVACGDVVAQVVHTMQDINGASQKIAEIISVIDGIAFQTNILALNAAVEAARAGEQGRGFAVVATEVRSLAGRSADAAKEIKTLITDSVNKVANGTALVDRAGQTMQEVVRSIQSTTDLMAQITAASAAQSSGIDEVNGAMHQIENMTQRSASLVAQAEASARNLEELSAGLTTMVAAFKLEG